MSREGSFGRRSRLQASYARGAFGRKRRLAEMTLERFCDWILRLPERVLAVNGLEEITAEPVLAARESLVIGQA